MTDQQPVIHLGQPVYLAGAALEDARVVMVMLHGRGSDAQSILMLASDFPYEGLAFLAPQADRNTWYPYSFLQPLQANEPYLSSALAAVHDVIEDLERRGIAPERIVLLGFSQGACLALEYAARHARRYGAVIAFSGGLIGDENAPRDYPDALEGTPIFLGCSDVDSHIPKARVLHSESVLTALGADVTMRFYPNMGHTINEDELDSARTMLDSLFAQSDSSKE
jgi:predicted esterase